MTRSVFGSVGLLAGAFALSLSLAAAPLAAQKPRCDSCDSAQRSLLQAEIERARRDLEAAARTLAAQEAALSDPATPVAQRDAVLRAQRELRSAEREFSRVTMKAMQQEMLHAAQRTDFAMRRLHELQSRSADSVGYLGIYFSGAAEKAGDQGREERWVFREYPVIEAVEPGSPAERAGIEAGDRLLALEGRDVRKGIRPMSKILVPGTRLPVKLRRDAEVRDMLVVVGRRPAAGGFGYNFRWQSDSAALAPDARAGAWSYSTLRPAIAPRPGRTRPMVTPEAPSTQLLPTSPLPPLPPFSFYMSDAGPVAGAEVRPVGDLGKDYFGVERGLLVLRVAPGTPSDRSGLRGGDVILTADGEDVQTVRQLSRLLERSHDHDVKLEIVRKRARQTLTLRW
ncbi:MAG: PDZ domain-containing protein [Gemmatimonadaceae bacterium]